MRINNNLMAMNTHRQLGMNSANGAKSIEKLSSGYRINRAGDDAAGLAISEKMRGQIRGLNQASRNSQDGISLIQTAEGALNETHAILQRMRELAVQSANDTNVNVDRTEIQKEVDQLAIEITRIANNTEFNTQKLTNGAMTDSGVGEIKFHIGANTGQDVKINIGAMDAKTLGVSRDVVASATGTSSAANIASSSFSGSLGSGVVDGAVLSFDYTAGQVGQVAVAAEWNTGAVTALPDGVTQTFIFNGVTISVAGTGVAAANVTGANAVTIGVANTGVTADQTAAAIIAAANAFKADGVTASNALDNFTFGGDGSGITILGLASDGDDNNALTITGSVGITTSAATVAGQDFVAEQSATVAITSSIGHTQTVNVADPAATSFTVSNGNFQGMTLNLATNISTDLDGAATLTLDTVSQVSSAARFVDKALIDEAKTYAGIDVSTQGNASAAIETVNKAIETVSSERSKLGAVQNRLEHTIKNLDTSSENLQASESRIRDVDMAKEMMEFTKNNILQQAAQAMLAQANQAPQGVLQLLR